jgi:hypothetical protein
MVCVILVAWQMYLSITEHKEFLSLSPFVPRNSYLNLVLIEVLSKQGPYSYGRRSSMDFAA